MCFYYVIQVRYVFFVSRGSVNTIESPSKAIYLKHFTVIIVRQRPPNMRQCLTTDHVPFSSTLSTTSLLKYSNQLVSLFLSPSLSPLPSLYL